MFYTSVMLSRLIILDLGGPSPQEWLWPRRAVHGARSIPL